MPAEQQQVDPPAMDWELAVDQAIAANGGDAREAAKALLVANASLEREVALWAPAVSYGFSRGWHRRRRGETD
ncbi:hypothetical protein P3C58_14805 [Mesorhizobium sp. XAP10]|nr:MULTISPECIES: hypothetical protein [unclassified Mesorhizobium]MDF3153244.1 hypothetical protein [Mesorhizobium sp. XAP10]MDF3246458.1 hypothetical protein [Mesorhizobium sp. XAP4]